MLRPSLLPACLLLAGAETLLGSHAFAQDNTLEQVIVVGSRIAQPKDQILGVTVISSEQMQQRGHTTVQQALDGIAYNSGGGIDQQISLGFTPAAAALNLRDLGVGRMLILIDGRRVPMYPIGFNGTDSFVDLASIPSAAVERIEILNQGASALYGSDAMSGVISIVLKKRADNEIALRYGDTTGGGGAEKRVQLSLGTGDDDTNASVFFEYYHRQPLWNSQRERTRSDRLGGVDGAGPGTFSEYGFPGTFADVSSSTVFTAGCDRGSGSPGLNADGYCTYNRAPDRQAWPDIRSFSATAKFDQQINESISWFTTLSLRNATTTTQIEALDFNTYFDVNVILPTGAANNPSGFDAYVFRRLVELGPRRTEYENQSYNAYTGLKGIVNGLNWQVTLQSAKQELQVTEHGLIRNDQIADALNGDLDFTGDGIGDPLDLSKRIPGAWASQLAYSPVSLSESVLDGIDVQLSGDLWQMPAGRAQLATVLEFFHESYFDHPDAELIDANVSYRQATLAGGTRNRFGAGVELQLPLLKQLQLNLAGRIDDYRDDSNVGGAFSPRAELKYRPSNAWLIRGSAGKSFRAPDLQRLYGGTNSSFDQLVNTPKCVRDGGAGRGDARVPSCVTEVFVGEKKQASLDLKEERGTHYTFGVFFKPAARWSASLDYFVANLRDLVQTPEGQYVLDENARNGSFGNLVLPQSLANCPFTAVCLLLPPLNIAYKKVSGIDGTVDVFWDTSAGRFSTGLMASYLLDVTMREAVQRPEVDVLRDGRLGEAVRLKGGVDLDWQRGAWGSTIHLDYIGPFTPLNTTVQKRIDAFTTVNVSASYKLTSGMIARVGINNLFDRMPPVDKQGGDFSQPFYQQQFHNVDGTSWYASIRQPF